MYWRLQWAEYCIVIDESPFRRTLTHRFKFGRRVHPVVFCSQVLVPLPDGTSMTFDVAIIDAKVPFLLGLDVLKRYDIVLDFGPGFMPDGKGGCGTSTSCI